MSKINTEASIDNDTSSSSNVTPLELGSKEALHQCKICGASALHSNFGAMTCSPCKMFFKRNAETGKQHFTCDFDGSCEVNINTRHVCSACRLDKCFANGMQSIMIRCPISKTTSIKGKTKKINQPATTMFDNNLIIRDQLPTLNLLQDDKSILTIDQWNLFSNLMNCYDERNGFLLAERFISEQNILPFKLRFKSRSVSEFLSTLFSQVELLFEKNHDFLSLYSHDRSILLHRQLKYVAIISSSFIAQQTHLYEYPAFYKTIETIFETSLINENKFTLFSFDIPFLKLALAIISFSIFDYTINEPLTNIKTIIQIQHTYTELAWRYLVYTYDDKQAVIYFSNLIRCILTVNDTIILMRDNKNFIDMINFLVQRTEQVLTIDSK